MTRGGIWASRDLQYPVRKFGISVDIEGGSTLEEWPAMRDEIAMATSMGGAPVPAAAGLRRRA